jgi:hypothetical protein
MSLDKNSPAYFGLDDEPQVVNWRELDASTERFELDRLGEWVTWLNARYCLDYKVIPDCWMLHGPVVEELSALRSLWEGCYQDDSAPSEPVAFHRELDAAVRRLREWNSRSGCSRTAHRTVGPPSTDRSPT